MSVQANDGGIDIPVSYDAASSQLVKTFADTDKAGTLSAVDSATSGVHLVG